MPIGESVFILYSKFAPNIQLDVSPVKKNLIISTTVKTTAQKNNCKKVVVAGNPNPASPAMPLKTILLYKGIIELNNQNIKMENAASHFPF